MSRSHRIPVSPTRQRGTAPFHTQRHVPAVDPIEIEESIIAIQETSVAGASGSEKRAGMSLLEVLISIGIVAVGLLGLAALLPLAGKQATQGLREDRAAAVGRRAFREFMIAGYSNRDAFWVFDGSQGPDDNSVMVPGVGICIDPLRCANYIDSPGGNELIVGNVFFPPPTILSGGNMKCVTLKARPYLSGSMHWAQAAATCFSHDELAMQPLSDDHSVAATPIGVLDGATVIKRDDAQDFSWFATVTNASTQQQALLSIVVVYKRDLTFTTNASTGDVRAGEVAYSYDSLVSPTGGEVFVFGATAEQLEVRPGWWVMLVSTPPTIGRQYRWFRVANASQVFDSSTISSTTLYPANPSGTNAKYRVLTLQGPDFPRSSAGSTDKCVFVRGAMNVYEKLIRLEKDNLYNVR